MADRVIGTADKVLQDFGDRVVKLAQINLGRTYTARRSNGKAYRKRIDSSGTLRKSLKSTLETRGDDGRFISGRVDFSMADYGKYVDAGRKPGKGIPLAPLEKWIRNKPLRLRDLESGGFVKMTDSRVRSVAYLISRKAKKKGIEATNFLSDPIEDEYPKLAQQLSEALGDDYTNAIANSIGDGSS